ncbi:hypothetical protein M9H77_17097 [Catharanthus roseus]|uniref:Uncharacterized protein n=1 Tax=Catharanthus roseus TaxID=4058 RepID=A0ACC0B3M9_CATRO|nr:hypothetical protein M9H77_17097 [Catharanthus roseus]
MWTLHHALRWDSRLGESQEGLKTKVGLRAPGLTSDMGERLLSNRALVWCLAGIDDEMPKLGTDDLVLGSKPCLWSSTVALHINSGQTEAKMSHIASIAAIFNR